LPKEARTKLITLIIFRFIMITLLFVVRLSVSVSARGMILDSAEQLVFIVVLLVTYFMTLIYLLFVKYNLNYKIQSVVQLMGDNLLWTTLISISGGIESPFTFLYIISLATGGMLMERKGLLLSFLTSSVMLFLVIFINTNEHYLKIIGQSASTATQLSISTLYNYILNLAFLGLIFYWIYNFIDRIKSAQEELKAQIRSFARLKSLHLNILETMRNGLIIVDHNSMIITWNYFMEEITGVSSDNALRRKLSDVLPKFSEFETTQDILPIETSIIKPDGARKNLMIWVSDFIQESEPNKGKMFLVDDLTEIRKLELEVRRRERLAALGKLSAGIAHEVKNPLAAISGAIQMLMVKHKNRPDDEKLLGIMQRETNRLNNLINDFLAYARPPTVRLKRQPLNQAVEELMPFFKEACREKAVRLYFVPSEAGNRKILIDGDLFRQVMWNIIINARDAASEGGGSVKIYCEKSRGESDHYYHLVVEDDGKGIPEDLKAKVFDPFFTTKSGGSGLGLTIAYQLMQAMGGKIELESDSGKGTRAELSFMEAEQKETTETNALDAAESKHDEIV